MILVALVVLPAIALVIANNHKAPPHVRTETGSIRQYVATWLAHHPGASCTLYVPESASCTAANGSQTYVVMGTTTTVAP